MKKLFFFAVASLTLISLTCTSCSKSLDKLLNDDEDKTESKKGTDYTNTAKFTMVDMGTGVKWATMNLGASKSSEFGDYYNFSSNLSGSLSDLSSDLKGSWRLPSKDDWKKLMDNSKITWVTINGIKGARVESNKNHNVLFFPACGLKDIYGPMNVGDWACYWSSSFNSSNGTDDYAWGAKFQQVAVGIDSFHATKQALSIRVICN
ncbi:MAG: hypothetical protein J5604_06685 [Bacteroidales bacterium]|nr:hypothetical protein [Bacteroidales bacterium]